MTLLTETNKRLFDIGILLLRCITGLILFVAGAGKIMGWFGGMGMKVTLAGYASMNISAPWTYISSFTEFIGGFLLIIGLITRPVAILTTINMMVATYIMGTKNFFAGGGVFPLTLMITSMVILLCGPMQFSLDNVLFEKNRRLK